MMELAMEFPLGSQKIHEICRIYGPKKSALQYVATYLGTL